MCNWIKSIFTGSEEVEFASSFGMEESVERLRAATRRSIFSSLGQQAAVGAVKRDRVSLQRVIPMVGNSFKPFFRGRFIERDGKVVLIGRFSMLTFVKIFITLWFGGLLLVCLLFVAEAIAKPDAVSPVGLVAPVGMLAGGVALVRGGKWFARNDTAWLSNVISRALNEDGN